MVHSFGHHKPHQVLQPLLLVCLSNILFPSFFLSNGELNLLREAKYSEKRRKKKEFDFPSYPFNWFGHGDIADLLAEFLGMQFSLLKRDRLSWQALCTGPVHAPLPAQSTERMAILEPWTSNPMKEGAIDLRRKLNLGQFPSCLWRFFLDIKFIWETKCYCWSSVDGFLLNLAKCTLIGLIGFKFFEMVNISSLSVWWC